MKKSLVRSNLARASIVGAALLGGCAGEEAAVGFTAAPVIYDFDDRVDVYQVTDFYGQIAEQAIGVIIPDGNWLVDNGDGTVSPVDYTLSDWLFDSSGLPMCPDEVFSDHPAIGSCSGTLITNTLFMTAGHCAELCADGLIAFDFYFAADGVLEDIDEEDLYSCDRVVVEALTPEGLDYAIFELDRPVLDRQPATVDVDYDVEDGDPLVVMGFPTGIPLKLDDGGVVVDARTQTVPDYFYATTDTFGGNSGSGVFDAFGVAVGILVRGDTDYVAYELGDGDAEPDCVGVNVIDTDTNPQGEAITYVARAIAHLCDAEPVYCGGGMGGGMGGGTGGGAGGGTGGSSSSGGCAAAPGTSSPMAGLALALAALVARRRRRS